MKKYQMSKTMRTPEEGWTIKLIKTIITPKEGQAIGLNGKIGTIYEGKSHQNEGSNRNNQGRKRKLNKIEITVMTEEGIYFELNNPIRMLKDCTTIKLNGTIRTPIYVMVMKLNRPIIMLRGLKGY